MKCVQNDGENVNYVVTHFDPGLWVVLHERFPNNLVLLQVHHF